jgi:serine/threonine protein kinase
MSDHKMIGTVVDGCYRVTSVIGDGQFGVVYRCEDLNLQRDVALKMFRVGEEGAREMESAIGEARKLATLNHPNVVHVYRLGTYEGEPFIAMEFIEGKTLRAMIAEAARPLKDNLLAMRQVAAGLNAIHSMGLIHRDLSTNNIMITDSGIAKILDLGLAKDSGRIASVESQNRLAGTVSYIAPEVVTGLTATVRSEVFSFGVILYEVLTGRHPFQAEHFMSLLYNITSREPDPLASYLSSCPHALSELVDRCLQKNPADRPAGMADVERGLAEILGSPGLDATLTMRPVEASLAPRATPRNPYLNRVMIKRPGDFFGRRQEVKRIFARLNATPPGSVSVVGDRKIGKSSLLNHIYMRQQRQEHLELPEKMIMVFLDLQQEKSMSMESFVRVMLGITNYELRGRLDVSDCALSLDGIKDMVQRLDGAGFRLAILLDEFDIVTTNRNFDLEFFSFLRFLANHYNVAYLTSSARDLQVLCHTKAISDSPFFNIFSTMRLSAFSNAEAEELIRVPSEKAGHPLADHVKPIVEMAGRFPFFIQMTCSHACEYLEEHADGGRPDFAEIRKRFYQEARLHFRYVWENLDEDERSVLVRVARRRAIPDSHRHVLQELGARDLVESAEHDPRLFATTFEEFVIRDATPSGRPSFLDKLFKRSQ